MGRRGLDVRKLLFFYASVFVLLGQVTLFISSHFAFMADRGRLAVLSLYVLGAAGDH